MNVMPLSNRCELSAVEAFTSPKVYPGNALPFGGSFLLDFGAVTGLHTRDAPCFCQNLGQMLNSNCLSLALSRTMVSAQAG